MSPTDVELLARIADENADAFSSFYDRHAPRAYGLLRKMLPDSEDADDVLQEVFWQVWTRAERFDPQRGSAGAWLTLITRSRALDRRRRKSREPVTFELSSQIDDRSSPAELNQQAEEALGARVALKNLQKDQREAIQLAFFGGLSHSEIAARENLPLGTVKTRIRTGMTKLRDALIGNERGIRDH